MSATTLPSIADFSVMTVANFLVNAPVVYGLLERRLLYYLTLEVKHRFTEKNLGVPESWQDLYFQMTDADLAILGGKTHVLQTYEALSEIGKKFVTISFKNKDGQTVIGKVHWVDTFYYNADTKMYTVRVSPEIMPYLINLSRSFTAFDVATAMMMSSKFGQKFYELCSLFSGDFRFTDKYGYQYKKNVVPIDIDYLRAIFNLNEVKDERTGKVLTKGKYKNFNDVRKRVIEPSQKELYELYIIGKSNVWFDYSEGAREGRKIKSIYLYIYTRENPKRESLQPWKKGDAPLCPFDDSPKQVAKEKPDVSCWDICSCDELETVLESLLNRYLKPEETGHYLRTMRNLTGNRHDAYMQAIQVVLEKEKQPKFATSTLAYKRKNVIQYALQENLKEYGWSMKPPKAKANRSEEYPSRSAKRRAAFKY